jgi:hypothetical protein
VAEAEADRLEALAVPELAAEILPAFGPDGPGEGDKEIGTFEVGMFLMRDSLNTSTVDGPKSPPYQGFSAHQHGDRAKGWGGAGD